MSQVRSHRRPEFDEIDSSVLTMPVQGRELGGARFEDQLAPDGTLIAFLRHLGCSFCREMIADMRSAAESDPAFPPVLFVHQGSVEQGEELFAKLWPTARAISDPQKRLYGAFKIERGRVKQLIAPGVLSKGLAAIAKGHWVGTIVGDPLLMPGLFFVRNRKLVWRHRFTHIGDHPDFKALPKVLRGE